MFKPLLENVHVPKLPIFRSGTNYSVSQQGELAPFDKITHISYDNSHIMEYVT